MVENYKNLPIDQKRNEFNKETLRLLYIVNKIIDDPKTDYYNYNINDENITEEDFLYEEYLLIKEVTDKLVDIFK